jgi:hypothetical protein
MALELSYYEEDFLFEVTEQLPGSTFEHITADDKAKGKLEQNCMVFAASLSVNIHESLEDLLPLANAVLRVLAAVLEGKKRLVPASRGILKKAGRARKDRSHVCSVQTH